ncbi:PBPRA1643 family SWIM/SEC-C metal-binding motif protein [Brumicola nitratireducens]|uniref:SEC-C motif domain protein n=1 Tax=Glaciecola nitratireducens (strain JCM 12485 / KCTC 12276 / FR1064) TaxID=1085623 RepID=G4QMK8_GLANF|nr:PBPRA1643 family SWIM/SEC-C metal-binding motif protein [Glaciecola nitratireducens]AEP30960.1 SEC-C motif domain protein [Glaciecola nitratireducens FR1064]
MSDKFFFMGRQDPRQSHIKYGNDKKPNTKAGSKKYPLTLIVTSEVRKQEVEALIADANLYAVINIDNSEGAVESIDELSAILSKAETVTVNKVTLRNDPCVCGSGKKYKKCCGK